MRPPPETRSPDLRLSVQCGDGEPPLPVDRRQLRRWVVAALEGPAELTLRFVGLAEGRRLNRAYRGQNHATNVLTFPYDPDDGIPHPVQADIVICLPVLEREARRQKKSLRDHLAHLVVHGVLHAQGYDHLDDGEAARMETRETAVLRRFGIADPYQAPDR
ncbi:MAG TPA: rRNA maturation RNase YbeY [Burkholderiaceae bacterium]|nr:rRNA maturation RNase YbeY [Burkholderiaceae bacterium]